MKTWETCQEMLLRYCVPPGDGVYTISSHAAQREQLHQYLYETQNKTEVRAAWEKQIALAAQAKNPLVLGICSDVGGGIQRGANWGPLLLRHEWYSQSNQSLFDLGDIRVIPQLLLDEYHSPELLQKCRLALYGDAKVKYPVSPLSIAAALSEEIWAAAPRTRLLTLGGDHSISYPIIRSYIRTRGHDKFAIIQFDAHTDLLADRLGVDITFGSWVSHIIPEMRDPSCYFQIGTRTGYRTKQEWQAQWGVSQYWADEIRQRSPKTIAADIVKHCQAKHIQECYITFDIDVLDITQAGATGTPESGGLMLTQILIILEEIARHIPITSADIVEVAPFVCLSANKKDEPHRTLSNARHVMAALTNALAK